MLGYIQPRIIFLTVVFITVSSVCGGVRFNSRLLKAVRQLSHAYKAGNESDEINLEYSHIAEGVHEGIENAVKECKNQFKLERWNCPVESSTFLTNDYVAKATREAAFIQAISAAGIMYHMTKKCNNRNQNICRCNSKEIRFAEDGIAESGYDIWKWRGCMRNLQFGEKVSKIFLDMKNQSRTSKHAVKIHNVKAGILAVTSSLTRQCKCHGPTGGCIFKTCWWVLPDFSFIAAQLKEKYKEAMSTKYYTLRTKSNVPKSSYGYVSKDNLAYSKNSPNYCSPDNTTGYQGMSGRKCKRVGEYATKLEMTEHEHTDCLILCCGNISRYPVMETETYDCECTFQWCCTVNCKKCQRNVWRYFCK